MGNKIWTVELIEDPHDPTECLLPFPQDMLTEVGWQEGDTLIWEVQPNGTAILTKKV